MLRPKLTRHHRAVYAIPRPRTSMFCGVPRAMGRLVVVGVFLPPSRVQVRRRGAGMNSPAKRTGASSVAGTDHTTRPRVRYRYVQSCCTSAVERTPTNNLARPPPQAAGVDIYLAYPHKRATPMFDVELPRF